VAIIASTETYWQAPIRAPYFPFSFLIGVGSRMVLAAQVVHLPNRSWLAVEFAISTHLNGRVRAL
tara:strand:+ start:67 stop:261 length:195 start_codon:yes stop_codon:yes gene_type:complete